MEPPSTGSIHLENESGRFIATDAIRGAIFSALSRHNLANAEVSVLFTSDEAIRDLNRRYRSIDEATDVLTFVMDDAGNGDIAIAVPYAERQAEKRGVALSQELAYLAIHGALHLAGFDDECEDDRKLMAAEMNSIATAIGLPSDENWASLLHEEGA